MTRMEEQGKSNDLAADGDGSIFSSRGKCSCVTTECFRIEPYIAKHYILIYNIQKQLKILTVWRHYVMCVVGTRNTQTTRLNSN